MSTATEIVKAAYRENNIIPVGRDPTDAEVAEALPRLNNIVQSLFGRTLGIYLRDWQVPPTTTSPVDARYPNLPQNSKLPDDVWPYPPNNVRLIASQTEAETIYLTGVPQDGAQVTLVPGGANFATAPLTLDANGRLINGAASLVVDSLTTPRKFMYRADLASWTEIVTLEADTEMPFPAEFDDYFICALNIRMSPRYSVAADQLTAAVLGEQMTQIKTRYWQEQDSASSVPNGFNARQSWTGSSFGDDGGMY